jgi:hypothetical protein
MKNKSTILHINKIAEDYFELESVIFIDDAAIKFCEFTCKNISEAKLRMKLQAIDRIDNDLSFEYIA